MKKFFIHSVLTMGMMLCLSQPAQAMFFPNGDFETADLSGYFVQEDFADVPSSTLVTVIDDGTGNHVAEVKTGFTSDGVFSTTLGRDIGTIPDMAENLYFDFKVSDDGPDFGGGGFSDFFAVSLLTDLGDLGPIINADTAGFTIFQPTLTTTGLLPSGFIRVVTDISGFRGATNSILLFDLFDEDDGRLTLAQIDNLELGIVPEPATLILFGSGFLTSLAYRRKKVL